MDKDKESPEERRERMRQKELKGNPTGNLKDSFQRANFGSLIDLVGGLNWKGTILIIIFILGIFIISKFL